MDSRYLTQALIFFGFYVVLTKLGGPDGGRAGFATVAAICLIRFVVEQVQRVRHRREHGAGSRGQAENRR